MFVGMCVRVPLCVYVKGAKGNGTEIIILAYMKQKKKKKKNNKIKRQHIFIGYSLLKGSDRLNGFICLWIMNKSRYHWIRIKFMLLYGCLIFVFYRIKKNKIFSLFVLFLYFSDFSFPRSVPLSKITLTQCVDRHRSTSFQHV